MLQGNLADEHFSSFLISRVNPRVENESQKTYLRLTGRFLLLLLIGVRTESIYVDVRIDIC